MHSGSISKGGHGYRQLIRVARCGLEAIGVWTSHLLGEDNRRFKDVQPVNAGALDALNSARPGDSKDFTGIPASIQGLWFYQSEIYCPPVVVTH